MRRLDTTGLMVDASRKVHANIGVLSFTKVDVYQAGEALTEMKTASWKTSAANLRSKLVMVPSGLVKLTISWVMLSGHVTRQV